ncbi:MAG: hypothetical protein ACUVWO_10615 [Thermodesulfobacteriota bacterium]
MPETTIIDTSSLIALDRINLLEMLCRIYKDVIVPESVLKEFGNLTPQRMRSHPVVIGQCI